MRIERHPGLHENPGSGVAPAPVTMEGPQRSFTSALQRQRTIASESRSSPSSQPQRTNERRQIASSRDSTARTDSRAVVAQEPAPLRSERTPTQCDEPLEGLRETATDLARHWQHGRFARDTPSCMEVVHASTGSRFLLSREGDVWLLSFQSNGLATSTSEAVITQLRELFAEQGLGQLDVVWLT